MVTWEGRGLICEKGAQLVTYFGTPIKHTLLHNYVRGEMMRFHNNPLPGIFGVRRGPGPLPLDVGKQSNHTGFRHVKATATVPFASGSSFQPMPHCHFDDYL